VSAGRDLPLLASGRDADVYALDHDRVLRRFRDRGHGDPEAEAEARIMAHVAEHGYPVPRVHDATGTDLVLDRLYGPTLLASWRARPWLLDRNAATLAALHDRLAAVPAPGWLPPPRTPRPDADGGSGGGGGGSVLHLDLHMLNVIVTPDRGPVVIDWTNAAAGDPALDLARTLATITTVEIPGVLTRTALRLYAGSLRRHAHTDPRPRMADAARAKLEDPNITPAESARLRALLRRSTRTQAG
jgi:aminoglycoside phosphotransferase (APT) family kinase protein